ncbi:MAG: hypothetical protein RPS47_08940 [Colwellia sp.]
MYLEELNASKDVFGAGVFSGGFIKEEKKVLKFIGWHGVELLSPTRQSFLDLGFKCDDVDVICRLYGKVVFDLTFRGVFTYTSSFIQMFSARLYLYVKRRVLL